MKKIITVALAMLMLFTLTPSSAMARATTDNSLPAPKLISVLYKGAVLSTDINHPTLVRPDVNLTVHGENVAGKAFYVERIINGEITRTARETKFNSNGDSANVQNPFDGGYFGVKGTVKSFALALWGDLGSDIISQTPTYYLQYGDDNSNEFDQEYVFSNFDFNPDVLIISLSSHECYMTGAVFSLKNKSTGEVIRLSTFPDNDGGATYTGTNMQSLGRMDNTTGGAPIYLAWRFDRIKNIPKIASGDVWTLDVGRGLAVKRDGGNLYYNSPFSIDLTAGDSLNSLHLTGISHNGVALSTDANKPTKIQNGAKLTVHCENAANKAIDLQDIVDGAWTRSGVVAVFDANGDFPLNWL